jgi:quinol-cytochrome oxidoreductase complex cytochrome b subunit
MRFVKRNPIFSLIHDALISYRVPGSITYFWNFGFYAGLCLAVQIITGIFLAMHYTPDQNLAMESVEHIMRDVTGGWLIRYIHANGASFFFIAVYLHIFRGLYYGSYLYPRQWIWIVGIVILLLMIITAFLGYVLPWGQMSFWGATVITNLVSAVPFIGNDLVVWLWGGYSVDNATLHRFFSLHYLLPFAILAAVLVHIAILHSKKSSSPLGIDIRADTVPFYPYFTLKDLFGIIIFISFFALVVCFFPNHLGHPDNYVMANPMVTPTHIVPEWYFLPFYAILRSIPNKLGGVLVMLFSIIALALLPFFVGEAHASSDFSLASNLAVFLFSADVVLLGWLGSKPAEYPYVQIAQGASFLYFVLLLGAIPFFHYLEQRFMRLYSFDVK